MELRAQKRVYSRMEQRMNAETNPAVALKPGQLWKTDNGCILITDQGKRIIGYRKLQNPDQRAALTNLIRPEALACYLFTVGAVLEN